MRTTYIYLLRDPRDGAVRYVGKTVNWRIRHKAHRAARNETRCSLWIKELKSVGLLPTFEVIEEVPPNGGWEERERHWIGIYRRSDLILNMTIGGGGWEPRVLTEAEKEHLRQCFKGRPIPPEQRAQISKSLTGKKQSPETVAKRRETINRNREAAGLLPWLTKDSSKAEKRLRVNTGRNTRRHKAGGLIKFSPEWKAKIAETHRKRFAALSSEEQELIREQGRQGARKPRRPRIYVASEEARRKISVALKKYTASLTPEQRLVRMQAAIAVNPTHLKHQELQF